MKQVVLLGYSGHAFVVADAIRACGDEIFGYYDNIEAPYNPFGLAYLGSERDEKALSKIKQLELSFIVGIGDNTIRRRVTQLLLENNLVSSSIIHPRAIVSSLSSIKPGSFVAVGAVINPLTEIGEGAIINTSAVIEHECVVGNFCHVAPGAVLAGNVRVGQGSFIGANSVVRQGVTIGTNVTIGAGAVVVKDVPDNVVWIGDPAVDLKK